LETELNLDTDSNPDPELITDPDPNLQIFSDPAGSGCTTLIMFIRREKTGHSKGKGRKEGEGKK
jgi:hypothetical protein